MRMGTARVPHLPAGLPTVPCWGPAGLVPIASFRGDHGRLCLRRRRGTFRAAGCGPLQPGTVRAFGDRIPVPDGVECPRPRRHVPCSAGCPRTRGVRLPVPWAPTMSGALTQTARFAVPPAASTPSSLQPRAGQRHEQAAPRLRCGAAGVAAPVQARCSLSGEDCSRDPPNTQPQRVVIGRPQLVGYFCPIPHPDDEEADCE